MGDPLSDCSPLISAASAGKLRLVRLLVDGGAEVNGVNPRGETALLAACKALRGKSAGPETVKLLTYLLRNKADPNIQDRAGCTALMYACMERAGLQVASVLLAAGADPTMEDYSGASALVYAINAQHQPTVQVLMDACQARGRDIIIIATKMGANGGLVTRRYLNIPPSPDTSPVSCMSPSDIVLKTCSPKSPQGENIFNFRGASKHGSSINSSSRHSSSDPSPLSRCSASAPRKRVSSEPWLAIHNLACLSRVYEEGMRERSLKEEGDRRDLSKKAGGTEDEGEERRFQQSKDEERKERPAQRRDNVRGGENYTSCSRDFSLWDSRWALSLTEMSSSHAEQSCAVQKRTLAAGGSAVEKKLPVCPTNYMQLRRNTLPSVRVVPPLPHLPPLLNQSDSPHPVSTDVSPRKWRSTAFLPHPPGSSTSSSSLKATARPPVLPPLTLTSSATSLLAPSYTEGSRRSLRRHSAQLEEIRGANQSHVDFREFILPKTKS